MLLPLLLLLLLLLLLKPLPLLLCMLRMLPGACCCAAAAACSGMLRETVRPSREPCVIQLVITSAHERDVPAVLQASATMASSAWRARAA